MVVWAWYAVALGALMIVQWGISLVTGGVPELQTAPWEIALHLAAEGATALTLIAGGAAALRAIGWGKPVLLVGFGMVIYSMIVSPGYFAERSNWAPVLLFAALLVATIVAATEVARRGTARGD